MKLNIKSTAWWGAPKKFSVQQADRKISWLELFYDLVYVIAIAKITHHFSEHLTVANLSDYFYFFAIIFWGWLNGSLYYDLHASEGLRTRLMTLWQMLVIAALVITIDSEAVNLIRNIILIIMVIQLFITYLWWSVGIYDKDHRKLNRPYTILYLFSFSLLGISLFLRQPYQRTMLCAALILNYLPPFLIHVFLKRSTSQMRLSSSMAERLGLFTIILFGEVITNVVNGVSELHALSLRIWVNFSLAVAIVFALWWIFFTIASDRKCKPGLIKSSLLELLFLPALIGLGLLGMAFNGLFSHYDLVDSQIISTKTLFGYALSLFLLSIGVMMFLLEFPTQYTGLKKGAQRLLFFAFILILSLTILTLDVSLPIYLLIMLSIILTVILLLNFRWYSGYTKPETIGSGE